MITGSYDRFSSQLSDDVENHEEDDQISDSSSQDSTSTRSSDFEPAWSESVRPSGDVFYLEGMHRAEPMVAKSHVFGSQHRRHVEHKKKKTKDFLQNGHVDNLTNGSGHNVTFNDIPTGVIREVELFVDPSRHNYGRRASLCETLFGIIPGFFNTKHGVHGGSQSSGPDRRIMIQGLLPGGEAIKTAIKIGEWLMLVNDDDIDFDNMDSLLAVIDQPQKVKLTLQKIAIETSVRPSMTCRRPTETSRLVRLVSGDKLREPVLSLHDKHHCVLYLTLDCNSENLNTKDDIVYQFPQEESKLTDVRGMFITLSHLLVDVTNNTARNSCLLVGGELVHIAYCKENREVLVIALPASRSNIAEMNHLMDDIVRILRLLHGSLHVAFNELENHSRLDHLFAIVMQRHLLADELSREHETHGKFLEPFFHTLPAVRCLTLPEETKVVISNCLSELEAADFADMSEDFYDLRRSYTIQGSCLFYKGYLLASHLHKEDLYDIFVYSHHYCLLTLCHEEQLGQLVVWREVFPTRRCHRQVDPLLPGYTEPEARWFLLLVGRSNALLGVLLEAGGCATWADGNPSPDPFYIDQTRATLLQLEARDVFHQCEIRLQAPPVLSLACANHFLPRTSQKRGKENEPNKSATSPSRQPQQQKKPSQPESILKKRNPSPHIETYRQGGWSCDDSDADSQSTGTSEGSAAALGDWRPYAGRKASAGSDGSVESAGSSNIFKSGKNRRNMLNAYDLNELYHGLDDAKEPGSCVKLTSGIYNTLFHYVQMDTMDGLFICPTQQELLPVATSLHKEIMEQFHYACILIRKTFQEASLVTPPENGSAFDSSSSECRLSAVEEGILFSCTPPELDGKKHQATLTYWVVGRIFGEPHPQEFYVCFHDSAHQNLVELAFKLGFGLLL